MAYPLKGFPFFEEIASTSPIIAKTKPTMKPTGKQQQLTSREIMPKTREVTAIGLTGGLFIPCCP